MVIGGRKKGLAWSVEGAPKEPAAAADSQCRPRRVISPFHRPLLPKLLCYFSTFNLTLNPPIMPRDHGLARIFERCPTHIVIYYSVSCVESLKI
jgi:hypothetical protein